MTSTRQTGSGRAFGPFETNDAHYWTSVARDLMPDVTMDRRGDGPFVGKVQRFALADLSIASLSSTGCDVNHSAHHIASRSAAPTFLLQVQLSGSSVNRHAGRETWLSAGDAILFDRTRPFSLSYDDPADFLLVRMPHETLMRRIKGVEDLVGLPISGARAGSKALLALLKVIFAEGAPSDPEQDNEMAAVVADVLALACRGVADDQGVMRSWVERRVLAKIDARLADENFGVPELAKEFGLSMRSIQKMFAARGTTPTAYILSRRLSAAGRALEIGDRSITAVAMQHGFNDLTYFGRAFRRAYGVSPREYRRHYC
jgi:AraC-like DNA-binding protein